MAKAFVVIQNGQYVEGRYDSKAEAEARAEVLRAEYPRAFFEFGKMDKKLYNTFNPGSVVPVDEAQ